MLKFYCYVKHTIILRNIAVTLKRNKMVRIEIRVSEEEAKKLNELAKKENRSRKSLCENAVKKLLTESK